MRQQLVVILNGPPGSGKDTIAALLRKEGYAHLEFKGALFEIAIAASGVSQSEWWERYEDRKLKEEPWDKLDGLSQREFLITISEQWVKPTLGKSQFGKLAASAVRNLFDSSRVVFSDGGFKEELATMEQELGSDNILLIRLRRNGFTFNKDSRSYILEHQCQARDINLVDGHPKLAVMEILLEVEKILVSR